MELKPGQKVIIKSKNKKIGIVGNIKIENYMGSGCSGYDVTFMWGKMKLHNIFTENELELPEQMDIFGGM